MRAASSRRRVALLVGLLAVVGCKDSRTRLPFSSASSPGLIDGPADIALTVREQTGQLVAVLVEFSDDNQLTFKQATPVAGAPPIPMFAANSAGTTAFFRWDPIQDLGPGIHRNVVLRVNSAGRDVGSPVTVTGVTVDLSDRLDPAPGGPVLTRPSAIALADGSVWIVGGKQTNGAIASGGVRFDPVTGLFTATPGLSEPRTGLGLALLTGGDVLVAGGTEPGGAVRATAELYRFDGTGSGQTTTAASLTVARDGAAVAALQDGRAVVIGGRGAGGAPVAQVELFTPGTSGGAFSVAFSDPRAARLGATATLLGDGRVLLLGGVDGAGLPVTDALVLDAAATGFTSAGTSQARAEHAAVRLADGRVLAVGGTTALGDSSLATSSVDLFDPAQNKFAFAAGMSRPRHRPGLAYAGGYALVVGDSGVLLSVAERFDPDTLQWTSIAGQSSTLRTDAVAVATGPGRAVVVGGGVAPEVYTPEAQAVGGEPFDEVRSVPAARADHSATSLPDGSVLIVGGTSRAAVALTSVERFDPNPRLFSPRAPLLRARADHACTNVGQGLVLVVGGKNAQGVVPDAELYDPSIDRWTTAGALLVPRSGASAVFLSDGRVLVSGGVDAAGTILASQELWNPNTLSFSAGPDLAEARTDLEAVEYAGSILVGTGNGTAGATGGADLLVPIGPTQRAIPSVGPRGRAGLSAPPAGGGLVVAVGGEDATGAVRQDIGFVDLRFAPQVWLTTTRPLVIARAAPRLTPLGNGLDLLITGGRGANAPALDAAELYVVAGQVSADLGTSRRTNDPRQVKARSRHTATALPDGRLLVVGGFDERGVAIAGAELWRR